MLDGLIRLLGLDVKRSATDIDQRLRRLEELAGPERALAELTKGKGR